MKDLRNGNEYWIARDAEDQRTDDSSRVSLLPGFDEHLLGYKDRSAVLAAEHAQKVVPGNNGIFFPTLVVAGQVIGTWKRKLSKKALEIILNPFLPLEVSQESLLKAAQRYSSFLGLELKAVEVMTGREAL